MNKWRIFAALASIGASIFPLRGHGTEEPLVMAVFPRHSVEITIRSFQPIADHLAERLKRKVELVTAPDYESFWNGVEQNRYHLVHYNQYHYVRSAKQYGYRVILKNEEFGSDVLAGALFVHEEGGIETPLDLKGRKIVFGGGPTAMMSTIVPTFLLRQAGLGDQEYTRDYTKNPPGAVFAAYYGHASAGGAGDIAIKSPNIADKIDTGKLRLLAKSDPLTHLPWAVSNRVNKTTAEKIRGILAELDQTDQGRQLLAGAGLTALRTATDTEYDSHRSIIWQVLGEDYCLTDCQWRGEAASVGEDKGQLIMGVLPRRPQKLSREMFTPLAKHLSELMQRPVKLETSKDFEEFWKGVAESRYDLVHYNQYHYVKSHKLYGYEAILRNEEQKQSHVRPVIAIRKDGDIKSIEDLRGSKIIFGGGKTAMMAYIAPSFLLRQAGLSETDYESIYAINPVAGCRAMYLGQADACGSGDIMFRLPALVKHIDVDNVRFLAEGEPLAFLVWAVNPALPEDVKAALVGHMTELSDSQSGKAILKSVGVSEFLKATDDQYDPHRKIIHAVMEESY